MLNLIEPVSSARPRRVLMVEDDLVCRAFLRMSLQKQGYDVSHVESAEIAQEQLENRGIDYFDCVVTDYWMPGRNGLDLLDWVRIKDPGLATIILTGEGEKHIVTESLRRGATDFLEKPVNLQKLFPAIEQAIQQTGRQRQMARSDSSVKNLGRTQLWMVQSNQTASGKLLVDVCYHPKLEAGGDFLGYFQFKPDMHCYLLSDVSGHDLQAAYISAYFQGIFRGMLMRAAPLPEIFSYFNDFLVNEWNQADQLQLKNSVGTSLAAASVLINLHQQIAIVFTCGAPVPILVAPDGRARAMCENEGPPLGWFPDMDARAVIHSIAGGGTIYLWTDGLEELAEALDVHPLCLAFALQQAKQKSVVLPQLAQAKDDILFASIQLPAGPSADGLLLPLMVEKYRGDQGGEIDALAASWQRNLKLALPELSAAAEHDILLATREAMLNAMNHGCQRSASQSVCFQMSYHAGQHEIRIHVEDPGTGHQFDFAAHDENSVLELIDEHRGLIFIKNLAHAVKFERNGASLILHFQL